MKKSNYHSRHLSWAFSFIILLVLLLLILGLTLAAETKQNINFNFLIISIIITGFNLAFFFLPFSFKSIILPYVNQNLLEKLPGKSSLKLKVFSYSIVPITINVICGFLVLMLGLIRPLNLFSIENIIFLIGIAILIIIIEISYLFWAVKINQNYVSESEIDFIIKQKR